MAGTGEWQTRRMSNLIDGGAHFYGVYECADGKFITIAAIEPQFYAQFLEVVGFAADPAFADQNDMTRWPALRDRLAALFATKTRDEWSALLEGTDVCFAPVLDLNEAPSHPHMIAREIFRTIDGSPAPGPAPRFLGTPSTTRSSCRDQSIAALAANWTRPY